MTSVRLVLVITQKWARLRESALLHECGPEILPLRSLRSALGQALRASAHALRMTNRLSVIPSAAKDLYRTSG